jgi:hypothetical protein
VCCFLGHLLLYGLADIRGSTELHAANTLCCLAAGKALKASLICLAAATPNAVDMAAPCDFMQLAMTATVALLIAEGDGLGAADEGAAELAGADVGEEPRSLPRRLGRRRRGRQRATPTRRNGRNGS